MSKYGCITGEFDIDTFSGADAVDEIQRVNASGDIEEFITIETSRDMTGENVEMFETLNEFLQWRDQYGQPPDDFENP